MTDLVKDEHSPNSRVAHYYHRETVASGTTSDPIFVSAAPVGLAIHPGAGVTAAYFEVSMTPRTVIEATPASAKWVKWDKGNVAAAAADGVLAPITAVRATSTGGASDIEVLQLVGR